MRLVRVAGSRTSLSATTAPSQLGWDGTRARVWAGRTGRSWLPLSLRGQWRLQRAESIVMTMDALEPANPDERAEISVMVRPRRPLSELEARLGQQPLSREEFAAE